MVEHGGRPTFHMFFRTPGLQEPIAKDKEQVFLELDKIASARKGSKDVDDLQQGYDELKAMHKSFKGGNGAGETSYANMLRVFKSATKAVLTATRGDGNVKTGKKAMEAADRLQSSDLNEVKKHLYSEMTEGNILEAQDTLKSQLKSVSVTGTVGKAI